MSDNVGHAPNSTANVTVCEKINLPFTHVFLPAIFVIVFVVGTFANIWGLRSVCTGWSKLGNINIFILNLGIADLQYLSTLPFLVIYYAQNSTWIFGQAFCKITRFCFNLNLYGSIGFLTCISIYRYLGIVHPMKVMGKINTWHSVAISFLVWILVVIQILPDMFFDKTKPHSSACYDTTSDHLIEDYLPYSIGWTITGFVIPLLIILVCYGHIIVVLATNKLNDNALLKQRCLKLVIVLTVLFSVCFIPFHVFRNLNLKTRILKKEGTCHASFDDIYVAHQISRGLACLNSAINPLIYLIGKDDLATSCHDFCKRARLSLVQCTGAVIYRNPPETEAETETQPANVEELM